MNTKKCDICNYIEDTNNRILDYDEYVEEISCYWKTETVLTQTIKRILHNKKSLLYKDEEVNHICNRCICKIHERIDNYYMDLAKYILFGKNNNIRSD